MAWERMPARCGLGGDSRGSQPTAAPPGMSPPRSKKHAPFTCCADEGGKSRVEAKTVGPSQLSIDAHTIYLLNQIDYGLKQTEGEGKWGVDIVQLTYLPDFFFTMRLTIYLEI